MVLMAFTFSEHHLSMFKVWSVISKGYLSYGSDKIWKNKKEKNLQKQYRRGYIIIIIIIVYLFWKRYKLFIITIILRKKVKNKKKKQKNKQFLPQEKELVMLYLHSEIKRFL